MTSFQRVIKYLAIAFGVFLTVNIIGGIVFGLTAIFGITLGIEKLTDGKDNTSKVIEFSQVYEESQVQNLKINLKQAKLRIIKGDSLKVEASQVSKNFIAQISGDTLVIKDEKIKNFFNVGSDSSQITIYVPEEMSFENVKLDAGINEMRIDTLKANRIDFELGAGYAHIKNLIANQGKIEAGVGRTEIKNSTIENLKLNTGVGEFIFHGKLLGNTNIDGGVGRTELNLQGSKEDYKIVSDSGLGAVEIQDEGASGGKRVYGNGSNLIDIDGGVGAIQIRFEKVLDQKQEVLNETQENVSI